jgi:signal transduction histidine kinase
MLGHDRSFRKQHPQAWDTIQKEDAGQLMAENHLFSFQHLQIGSRDLKTHSVSHQQSLDADGTSAAATSRESGLVLVAKISQEDLYRRSAKTLRQQIFVYLGALCILAAMAWRLARSASLRRLDANRIAASEMRLRQLSTQLLTTQEEERRRISRDLHDELGQQATAIQLDLKSAIAARPSAAVDTLIRRAVAVNDQLIKNLHAIASRIRPSVLDDLGLRDAVESYLDEYAARTGIQVTFHLLFHRDNVPAAIGENTYRILQESLANAAKHSRASSVTVTLSVSDTKLELIVRDHGVGGEVEKWSSQRLGILGMRERAELLQGTFRISSRPGLGTEVVVTIPLPSESK